jgi:hypothetical protein
MVETQDPQIQFLLTDLNTRIKDIEERNSSIRERIILLSQNTINLKEGIEQKMGEIEKRQNQLNMDLKKIKSMLDNVLSEIGNFTRKEETILVERMLKDFQPLEFVRRKDVEEMINEALTGEYKIAKYKNAENLEKT